MKKKFIRKLDKFQLLTIPIVLFLLWNIFSSGSAALKVGVILPLTSEFSVSAQHQKNGIMLALEHINNAGGINGRKLEVIFADNNGSQLKTAQICRDMIYEDSIICLLGGIYPENTRIMKFFSEKSHTPFLTSACTHFEITDMGSPYTFRNITDDIKQFEAISDYALNKGNCKKPAIIYDTEIYGAESAQKLIEIAIRNGQIVTSAVSFKSGSLNYRKQIEVVKSSNPDGLIILAKPFTAALMVRHFRESGFNYPIYGGNSLATKSFIGYAGAYAEYTTTTLPFNPRLGGQRAEYFMSEYLESYSIQADSDAFLAYEALMLTSLALKASDTDTGRIKAAFSAMHGWDSVAGSGGFDSSGNQVRPAQLAVIKEEQAIPVGMEELF